MHGDLSWKVTGGSGFTVDLELPERGA